MHLLFGGITSRIGKIHQTVGSSSAIKATVSGHRGSKSTTPAHNEEQVADAPLIDNIKGKFQVLTQSKKDTFKVEENAKHLTQHLNG